MQAAYSSDRSLTAWGNLRWSPRFVTKTQTSIDPRQTQAMVQFDNEYTGDDFSASIKAISPSILEGGFTGIVIGSYLQSLTPKLALGLEGVWQRPALNSKPETAVSYCARYKGTDWIASAQYLAQGSLGASYWRRLTDKVEAGVDCQLQFAPGVGAGMFGGMRREGTTTVGVKYNFTNSVYRAQVDSAGKFGVVLEKRVAPPVTLTFAAEIDQWKVSVITLDEVAILPMTTADSVCRIRTSLVSQSHSKELRRSCKKSLNARTLRMHSLHRFRCGMHTYQTKAVVTTIFQGNFLTANLPSNQLITWTFSNKALRHCFTTSSLHSDASPCHPQRFHRTEPCTCSCSR